MCIANIYSGALVGRNDWSRISEKQVIIASGCGHWFLPSKLLENGHEMIDFAISVKQFALCISVKQFVFQSPFHRPMAASDHATAQYVPNVLCSKGPTVTLENRILGANICWAGAVQIREHRTLENRMTPKVKSWASSKIQWAVTIDPT